MSLSDLFEAYLILEDGGAVNSKCTYKAKTRPMLSVRMGLLRIIATQKSTWTARILGNNRVWYAG